MKKFLNILFSFFLLLLPINHNAIVKKWDPVLSNLICQYDEQAFIEQLKLPKLFGSAISEYQVSGASHLPASQ